MSFDWTLSQVFNRDSNIYNFTKDPLFRRNELKHVYMPWDENLEDELMYLIKAQINKEGSVLIPFMNLDQTPTSFNNDIQIQINEQVASPFGETHLVMSNLKSIHIYRVTKVLSTKK